MISTTFPLVKRLTTRTRPEPELNASRKGVEGSIWHVGGGLSRLDLHPL